MGEARHRRKKQRRIDLQAADLNLPEMHGRYYTGVKTKNQGYFIKPGMGTRTCGESSCQGMIVYGSYCNELMFLDAGEEFWHDSPLPQRDELPPHRGYQFLKP